MSNVVSVFLIVAVVAVVIGRQLRGESLGARRVLLLPAAVFVVGAAKLHGTAGVGAADVAAIATSVAIAGAVGLAQGTAMHLESRAGTLWGRMPVRGLWLWAVLIGSRLVVTVVAVPLGARAASSTASILLVLGTNRLAQAAVIAARAAAAGVPFAPRDGGSAASGRADLP